MAIYQLAPAVAHRRRPPCSSSTASFPIDGRVDDCRLSALATLDLFLARFISLLY